MLGAAILEGTLDVPVPDDYLARLAERARAGRFGAARLAWDVEETAGETGYRTAARTQRLRLRARPGGPVAALEDVTLERLADGRIHWRIDISRGRRRRLFFAALVGLAAALIIGMRAHLSSIALTLPIVFVAVYSLWSGSRKADEKARAAIVSALRAELEQERLDEALTSPGTNAVLARTIVERLEARGLALTEDESARILECDDAPLLDQWRTNAEACRTVVELFDGPRPTGPRIADTDTESVTGAHTDVDAEAEAQAEAEADDESSASALKR